MLEGQPISIDPAVLSAWALPGPDAEGDKESRGRVLVIGGSREIPGAALLAARSALRVGAGKLSMAVPASIAQGVALLLPESRVIALPESENGGVRAEGVELIAHLAEQADATVIGPGMQDEASTLEFVRAAIPLFKQATVVLDALAMSVVRDERPFEQTVIVTPHAGEMASLQDVPKDEITAQPQHFAHLAASRWNALVILKGAQTCIAAVDGRGWCHRSEQPGLGTSGSGDVLAGALAGLVAQRLGPEHAAAWAVAAHARCGAMLARRVGELGYLASEICDALPEAIRSLGSR